MNTIKLRFVRLPNDVNLWTHEFMYQDKEVIVSKFKFEELKSAFKIKDKAVVENDYTGICYEFLNKGFEIIKVLDLNNKLTGYYCNINRYPKMFDGGYEVVDLFLDVWVFPDLEYVVLDEDELEEAFEKGWIKEEDKKFAEKVLENLIKDLKVKDFPPKIVGEVG